MTGFVMRTDSWGKAYPVDEGLRIQPFYLGVCIQFIEITYTQGQISIGKQLYRFRFGKSHEKGVYIFFDCAFL